MIPPGGRAWSGVGLQVGNSGKDHPKVRVLANLATVHPVASISGWRCVVLNGSDGTSYMPWYTLVIGLAAMLVAVSLG